MLGETDDSLLRRDSCQRVPLSILLLILKLSLLHELL